MDTDQRRTAAGDGDAIPARIDAVRVAGTPQGPVPVVLLAADNGTAGPGDEGTTDAESDDGATDTDDGDTGGTDVVPIFIGFEEATSIARGVDATDIGRPLTHDLLLDTIEELGGRVVRVTVSGIDDGTFIADLHVRTPRDETVIDARPSDALALAARTNAPITVAAGVYEGGREDADRFADLDDIREVAEIT